QARTLVAGRGDQRHACAAGVVDGLGFDPVGGVCAEGHVDHVGAVVGGPDDAPRDVGGVTDTLAVEDFHGKDPGVGRQAGDPRPVGLAGDHACEEGAVPVVVLARPGLAGDRVVA